MSLSGSAKTLAEKFAAVLCCVEVCDQLAPGCASTPEQVSRIVVKSLGFVTATQCISVQGMRRVTWHQIAALRW